MRVISPFLVFFIFLGHLVEMNEKPYNISHHKADPGQDKEYTVTPCSILEVKYDLRE